MKKIASLLLVLLLVLSITACKANSPATSAKKKIVIGLSICSLTSTFFVGEQAKAQEIAKKDGAECISVNANGDATKQKTQIEDLISKKVNAIVCVPQDTAAIVSSASECKAAGIPFIAMGRMPADMSNVTLGVICDNIACAQASVQAMLTDAKTEGYASIKAIELIGALTDQNAVERSTGFEKYAAENNITIVAKVATEWDVNTAFSRFTDTLHTVSDFNAIYVPSDMLLPPIMSVLTTNGRWVAPGVKGHVIITSIDGDPSGLAMVNQGFVYSDTNTDAFDFGRVAMQGAIDIANGIMPKDQKVAIPQVALTKDAIASAGSSIWGNVYKS